MPMHTMDFFKKPFIILSILCIFIAVPSGEASDTGREQAFENYINLKKLYIKWNEALPGSKTYFKERIKEYLIGILGQEIITEHNYELVMSSDLSEKKLVCRFLLGNWLQINGTISDEAVKNIMEINHESGGKWPGSGALLSVAGKIKIFSFGSNKWGDVIFLSLKNIRLEQLDNTGQNNKKQEKTD